MAVDVTLYRSLHPDEIEEWEQLVAREDPPGETQPGLAIRGADFDPEAYLIRFRDDAALRACGWVTKRNVAISDQEMTVAGVRGVITDPDQRRRGYGRAVIEQAHELMRSFDDCDFALLFSSVMAVPFYESLGWQTVHGPVICDQPGGRIDYTKTRPTAPLMALALRQPADLPSGQIRVRGFPW